MFVLAGFQIQVHPTLSQFSLFSSSINRFRLGEIHTKRNNLLKIKSVFASERTYSPVPHNGSVNDGEAKDVEFLPAKNCNRKSMFYLVLDLNIAASDTIFVKKNCTAKICFLN